jgi:muramidase (phage lysozyme)/uncharacterized protein YciI
MRDAIALAGLLDDANVKAFLAVIRAGEGTADAGGYSRHFGGAQFDNFNDHPRKAITAGLGRNQYTSTAAGAYQFLARTWDGLVRQYGFADFRPSTQDIAALALIDGRKALDDVLAGRVADAVRKCNREWASLPGSPYGQPTRTMAQALAVYVAAGGAMAPANESITVAADGSAEPATTPKEATMPLPLIIGALLPSIIEAIPKLGKLFGSGSEVAERNVKAAELAVTIVQEAVGARNAQEAAEMVAADPAAAQAAVAAVESRWYELTESGGGGIDGARKADAVAVASGEPVWRSPSFLIAVGLLPLVYMIVANVVGILGAPLSDEVRSAIANGVVGLVLGGLIGYYYGQTTSRNRTPAQ